jgi:peroxiredoxin
LAKCTYCQAYFYRLIGMISYARFPLGMTLQRKFVWIVSALVVAGVALSTLAWFDAGPRNTISASHENLIGRNISEVAANDIILKDSGQNIFDVSNFTGRITVLHFYDAACKKCQQSDNIINSVSNKYKKDPLQVVFISSNNSVSFEQFADHGDKKNFRLFDEGAEFAKMLGIEDLPFDMIVDHDGIIRYFGSTVKNIDPFVAELDRIFANATTRKN